MIEVENLTKRYGQKLAVDGLLDFVVRLGIVTGFLGPNGAVVLAYESRLIKPGSQ